AGQESRCRLRRAGGIGRARRDPLAGRPHPGDVRRPDRRRGRGRRRRAHVGAHDGRGEGCTCPERSRRVRARRPLPTWAEIVVLPLVNIALAFITVGIIVRIIGVDPLHALELLVVGAFGSPESIGYTLYYATNFIFTGLAVSVAFHGGLFNIGGEGQAYIGGLGCGLAVLALDRYLPIWLMIPVGIAAAALFGAA